MSKVNLDALIPREDFEVNDLRSDAGGITRKTTISANDLKQGEFFYVALRKPDFQRETNEWKVDTIFEFIKSFLDGDLIPAVILWVTQGGYTFVIDGSHRLSALVAWVNDDYGDGHISRQFYEGIIPEEQLIVAERTRNLIKKHIGPFSEFQFALTNPGKVTPDVAKRAVGIATLAIQVQYVTGNASKAEASYFNINKKAAPIDDTEFRVLLARRKPNGIAARALIRGAKGHKYWSAFTSERQKQIQILAEEIHQILFQPQIETPIKTLDLPIAGKVYSGQALALALDFIHIVNEVDIRRDLPDDKDGSTTVKYLDKCRKIAQRINSTHPGSLGLHPVVYFYSSTGKHKTGSFLAVTALILEFEKRQMYAKFTKVRADFEELLVRYDSLTPQIIRKGRSALKSYPALKSFYLKCIDKLLTGKNIEKAVEEVLSDPEFSYLKASPQELEEPISSDFSRETKSEAFIRQAINTALRCKICNGYLHRNSISVDHIIRKADGGTGSSENAQLAHFYCNTSIKS